VTPPGARREPRAYARRAAFLAAFLAGACRGAPPAEVAELSAVSSGAAEKSRVGEEWRPASLGDRFAAGDRVRTSSASSARVRLLAGGGLRMGPSTTIQFGTRALTAVGELEADGGAAVVELEIGQARIAPGSRVRIEPHQGGLRFDVLVGRAVVAWTGRRLDVTAGQALTVIGDRVLRVPGSSAAEAGSAMATSRPGDSAAAGAPAREPVPRSGPPIGRADVSIRAGLSATIHDPRPPTEVRIRFAELCRGAGAIELARPDRPFRAAPHAQGGRSAAIVRLERGRHRYRVRCSEGNELGDIVIASGSLAIEKDVGTRPLPRQAPHNRVDADGRRYTVLYQNRLPTITFRWPGAPRAAGYRLRIAPRRGRAIQLSLASARHTIRSGELGEGHYRFRFDAPGQQRASRTSTLTIDFDNAARSGYLLWPRPTAPWVGDSVLVSGAATQGWRVAVSGAPVPLDRQHRFYTFATRAADENGIAVEFRHPTHGVHLYVRRGPP